MLQQQSIKRWHVGAACGMLLTAIAISPLASLNGGGKNLSSSQRLMAMFEARSPGERTKGEMAAAKLKKASIARYQAFSRPPSQRALGKVISPKPEVPKEFVEVLAPLPSKVFATELASLVPVGTIMGPPPLAFGGGSILAPSGGGGGGGIGGGGSGGGVSPVSPGSPIEVVAPAVPEPSTWAMMLLGFGMIGFSMRARRGQRFAMAGNI